MLGSLAPTSSAAMLRGLGQVTACVGATVLVRVFQRNRSNRVCVCKVIYYKELPYVITEADKS